MGKFGINRSDLCCLNVFEYGVLIFMEIGKWLSLLSGVVMILID